MQNRHRNQQDVMYIGTDSDKTAAKTHSDLSSKYDISIPFNGCAAYPARAQRAGRQHGNHPGPTSGRP